MTWRADAVARLGEKLAVDEAQAKLRAVTGADQAQIDEMTAQAQRLADSQGAPLSTALDALVEQIVYPPVPARTPDPLATLRAEVVKLRDDYDDWTRHHDEGIRDRANAGSDALRRVLDLIDKQREGQ